MEDKYIRMLDAKDLLESFNIKPHWYDRLLRPFRRVAAHLREKKDNLTIKCQRFRRGWAYWDVWDIDDWFLQMMPQILDHFQKHNQGYPLEVGSAEEWDNILSRMRELLQKMQKDETYSVTTEGIAAKDEFFELFSKYFYDLWW